MHVWPTAINVYEAAQNADARFEIVSASADAILRALEVAERESAAVRASLSRIATQFDSAQHAGERMSSLKRREADSPALGHRLVTFLRWRGSEMEVSAVHLLWEGIRMHGDPPLAALLQCETWRMNSYVEGAAFYERVIAHEQPRRTDRLDWQQLPYLGLAQQRILLTDDDAFNISARGILRAYRVRG